MGVFWAGGWEVLAAVLRHSLNYIGYPSKTFLKEHLKGLICVRFSGRVLIHRYPSHALLAHLEPILHLWYGRWAADDFSVAILHPMQVQFFLPRLYDRKPPALSGVWPWVGHLKVRTG